jgi:hypothetical protein
MARTLWADCWGGKSPIELIDAGYKGVSCYLGGSPSKDATPAQIALYRAAGLDVVLNYEGPAAGPLGGYSQGVADATTATQMAHDRNYPAGMVIVFSVDFEVTAAQIRAVCSYFDGAQTTLRDSYTTGVYGDAWVLDEVIGGGHATFGWQTSSWSDGIISPHANLLQYAYGNVFDTSVLLVPTSQLWGIAPARVVKPPAPAAPTPPTPPAVTTTENPDMFIARTADNGAQFLCLPDRTKILIPTEADVAALDRRFGPVITVSPAFLAEWTTVSAAKA